MRCEQHLLQALALAAELQRFGNEIRSDCDHEDCEVLDAVARDAARRLRALAEASYRSLIALEARRLGELRTTGRDNGGVIDE